MTVMINHRLIENCKNNDRKSQHAVYQALYPAAMRVCKRYCARNDEAMDVLNAGFLKVFTQISDYTGKGSFEGWVHRIMVNTALDHIRRSKLQVPSVELTEYPDTADELDEPDDLAAHLDMDALYGMIQTVPTVSRTVFNLYVFEEFTHSEIAVKLGISAGTSKWHLSNARKILKEKVQAVLQKAYNEQGNQPY